MTTPDTRDATSLEIASRLIKTLLFLGTIVRWGLFALGAFSVYMLWNVNPTEQFADSLINDALIIGWIAIGLMIVVRGVQIGIGWAILAPIEARIHNINLRDPEVAESVRSQSKLQLLIEAVVLTILVAIPLLIAHFRFHYFQ